MGFIFNLIKSLSIKKPTAIYSVGPNNFAELLEQFDAPPKEKTATNIMQDYKVFLTMAQLEVDMLAMDPPAMYLGTQTWHEQDKKCFDFVPCMVRPEVVYCTYGKN